MTRLFLLSIFLCFSVYAQAAVQQKSMSVLFETDQHELTDPAKQQLNHFIALLEKDTDFDIALSGHTDDIGNLIYNDKLASKRAATVKAYLLANGVEASQITDRSYGERKPLKANTSQEERTLNRRVELELTLYHFDSVDELNQTLKSNDNEGFVIDPTKANIIRGRQGVKMFIEPNTFVDQNGNIITENVSISLTEAIDMKDFFAQKLATVSGDQLLVSGGMYKTEVSTSSGKLVEIAEGKVITTTVTVNKVEPGMQVFTSSSGQNWDLTEQEIFTMPGLEMPPYPLLDYQPQKVPDYKRDMSTQPKMPLKKSKPKAPNVPVADHFKPQIRWYQLPFKGSLERDGHKRYKSEMERYQKSFEKYQKRYDLYVNHNQNLAEKKKQFEKDLIAWNMQCSKDSLTWLQSDEYLNVVELNANKLAGAKANHLLRVKKWEALKTEKMGELAVKMDEMGVPNERAMNTYILSMTELGWINIDRFLKMPENELNAIKVRDIDDTPEHMFIVFKNLNSMLPLENFDNDNYYERDRFPKSEEAAVLAYKVVDGQPMVYYEDITEKKKSYSPVYKPYTFKELNRLLSKVQG